jgi:hypothetical protein
MLPHTLRCSLRMLPHTLQRNVLPTCVLMLCPHTMSSYILHVSAEAAYQRNVLPTCVLILRYVCFLIRYAARYVCFLIRISVTCYLHVSSYCVLIRDLTCVLILCPHTCYLHASACDLSYYMSYLHASTYATSYATYAYMLLHVSYATRLRATTCSTYMLLHAI